MKQPSRLEEMARMQVFHMIVQQCAWIEHQAQVSGNQSQAITMTNQIKAKYLNCLPSSILDDICALSNQLHDSHLNDDTYLYRLIMHTNLKTFHFLRRNEVKPSEKLLISSARSSFWNSQLQLRYVINLDISNIHFSSGLLVTISIHCKLLEHLVIPALGRLKNSDLESSILCLQKCKELRTLRDFYQFGEIPPITIFSLLGKLEKLERINYNRMGIVLNAFLILRTNVRLTNLIHFSQYNPNVKDIHTLSTFCPNVKEVVIRDADDPSEVLVSLKESKLKLNSLEFDSFPCSSDIFDLIQAKPICANLRSLKLLRCTNDFDRCIIRNIAESCPQIVTLHLSSGWVLPVDQDEVKVNPGWFNHLQELLLRGSKCWDGEVFRMCLNHAPKIRSIKLDHFFNRGSEMSVYFLKVLKVNEMPELWSLCLWQYRSVLSREVLFWLIQRCHHLTDLTLYCHLADVSTADLDGIRKIVNVVVSNPPAHGSA